MRDRIPSFIRSFVTCGSFCLRNTSRLLHFSSPISTSPVQTAITFQLDGGSCFLPGLPASNFVLLGSRFSLGNQPEGFFKNTTRTLSFLYSKPPWLPLQSKSQLSYYSALRLLCCHTSFFAALQIRQANCIRPAHWRLPRSSTMYLFLHFLQVFIKKSPSP